jgi:hypothetical protein
MALLAPAVAAEDCSRLSPSTDMTILGMIALPDQQQQLKYEAMGLPDPVAFAALVALGAIPNPLAMIDCMMSRASGAGTDVARSSQAEVPADGAATDGDADRSFVEAFQAFQKMQRQATEHQAKARELLKPIGPVSGYAAAAQRSRGLQMEKVEMEKERIARQARSAADQAKSSAKPVGEADAAAREAKDKILALAFGSDDVPERPPPPGSLASHPSKPLPDGGAVPFDKVRICRLPPNVTESSVRLECARYGAVVSVILEADAGVAYAAFAMAEMAGNAVRRMSGRELLGSTEPLDVQAVAEVPETVRLAPALPQEVFREPDPADLPEYLKPRRRGRPRSRRRSARRSRSRRGRRSWLSRSRSRSHTQTGQYIRAVGCTSSIRWWERKQSRSSSSSRSRSRSQRRHDEVKRPRQVAVSGNWVQFRLGALIYYHNVLTMVSTWDRPLKFDPKQRSSSSAAQEAITGALL